MEDSKFEQDSRYWAEDRTLIKPGTVLFNYYDQEPVLVRIPEDSMEHPDGLGHSGWDGWFHTQRLGLPFDGGPLLNGARMCGLGHQQAQRWLKGRSPDQANDLIQNSIRHGREVVRVLLEAMTPAKLLTLCDLNGVGDGDEHMGKRTMVKLLLRDFFDGLPDRDAAIDKIIDAVIDEAKIAQAVQAAQAEYCIATHDGTLPPPVDVTKAFEQGYGECEVDNPAEAFEKKWAIPLRPHSVVVELACGRRQVFYEPGVTHKGVKLVRDRRKIRHTIKEA